MAQEYRIELADKPEWSVIGGGISQYNTQQTGDDRAETLCFVVKGPDEAIAGGVIGEIYWQWLHVDLLWMNEALRGCGYGQRLLVLLEEEARRRGANHAYLDTFTFQAPDFYRKNGYEVFGELPDFPPGHTRYFMKKDL